MNFVERLKERNAKKESVALKWKLLVPLNIALLAVMAATFITAHFLVKNSLLKQTHKRIQEQVSFLVRDLSFAGSEERVRSTTQQFCMSMVHHMSPRHHILVQKGEKVLARGMPGKSRDLEELLLAVELGTHILPYGGGRVLVYADHVSAGSDSEWTIRVSDDLADMEAELNRLEWIYGASIGLIAVALLLTVNSIVRTQIAVPATVLCRGISQIMEGNFNITFPKVRTREFAVISDALQDMSARLVKTEKMKLKSMEEAGRIQQCLLAPPNPQIQGLEAAVCYRPCEEIGGDYCDVLELGGQVYALIVGDVTGHGVSAALTTTMLKVMLEHHLKSDRDLSETVSHMNEELARYLPSDRHASLFCGLYFARRRILKYVNAGHPPPFLVRACSDEVEFLKDGGPFLGVPPAFGVSYKSGDINLSPGDRLVLYTDGATEQMNAKDEFFGLTRLVELCRNNSNQSSEDLIKRIIRQVTEHADQISLEDDIALLVGRVMNASSGT